MYERDLRRVMREAREGEPAMRAVALLRRIRPEVRKLVAERTGAFQYDIDRVYRDMVKSSARLDLVVPRRDARADSRTARRVAAQLRRYLAQGHHLFAR
jgi:hypothetical protein